MNFLIAPLSIVFVVGLMRWLFLRFGSRSSAPAWLAIAPFWWSYPNITSLTRGRKFVALGAELACTYLVIVAATVAIQTMVGMPTGTIFHKVMEVAPGAAADGVLEPGDVITHVGGQDAAVRRDGIYQPPLTDLLQSANAIELRLVRGGRAEKHMITPRFVEEDQVYMIGVALDWHYEHDRAIRLQQAFGLPLSALRAKISEVGEVIEATTGRQTGELSGPVGISTMTPRPRSPTLGLFSGLLLAGLAYWILVAGNLLCIVLPPYSRKSP